MINQLKRMYKKISPQHILLICSLLLIFLPVLASASDTSYWELPKWSEGGIAGIGKGGISNQEAATAFYQRYHIYLTPLWGILAPLVSVGGRLVQFIVSLPGLFQDIFFGSVKLLGIYTQLEDQQTELGKLFILMQTLGAIVFGLTSIVYFTYVIFNGKSKTVKKVMETAVILFLFIGFIPWGLNKVFAMSSSAITDTSKATTPDIGLTLIQNNVVDKEMVTMKNWDVKLDSSGAIENPSKYNQINSVYGWDPGETLGVINVELLETLDEGKKKTTPSDQNYFQNIFKSQLVTYPEVTGVSGKEFKEKYEVGGISYHKTLTAANYMEANYLRYKVNWLPLIISALAISLIYIMMTLKVGTSAFVTVATTIAAPVLAALKAKSPKKVKEEIGHIMSGAYSVFFEFLIVVVAMYMMLWINSSSATEIIAKTGLSALQAALLKCFFYVGLFYGVMSGVQAVERFIGISTSHQNPMQQMASTMIVAGGLAKGTSAVWDTMMSGGGNVLGKLNNVAQGARNEGKSNDDYMKYFNSSTNKNEENPYHSNDKKDKEGYSQGEAFSENKYSERSDGTQKSSNDEMEQKTKSSPEPNNVQDSHEAFETNDLEMSQTEGAESTYDPIYSNEQNYEDNISQPYIKSRKEKAMESLNMEKDPVQPDYSSDSRQFKNDIPYNEQHNNFNNNNNNKEGQKSNEYKQERPHSAQNGRATTLDERVKNMEEQFNQQSQNQQRSQRAQQAAQRMQKRQMANQQIQSGTQRIQGASQNQFVGPVEEEEE